MNDAMAIGTENRSCSYMERAAFEDISLAIDPGRFTALPGPNGSVGERVDACLARTGLCERRGQRLQILRPEEGHALPAWGGPREACLEILSC